MHVRHTVTPGDVPHIAQLWALLGWGTDDGDGQKHAALALAGSSWIALAEVDGQFAGYARALSDGVLVTYLVEVAVLPAFRRRGVGGTLIRSCVEAFRHTAVYADASPAVVGLHTRYGLVPRPSYLTACARGPQKVEAT